MMFMKSKLFFYGTFIACILGLGCPTKAWAHFGMLIPSEDMVDSAEEANLDMKVMFAHPFEGQSMDMEKPVAFGVMANGEKINLLDTLRPYALRMHADEKPFQAWQTTFNINRPGDYQFYVQPAAYWEPAEDCYIVHYTKVIVDAYGKEDSWDEEIGLKTEIVPLTRPFGIYAGNVFQGVVKVDGKPVPFSEVEIEYYDQSGRYSAPKAPFVTQVVKCDANGVFTYAVPKSGWWGFAALNEDDQKIQKGKEMKPVEIGAVLWIKAYDMLPDVQKRQAHTKN
jgi:cobalt/nickel transport protein